MRDGQPPYDPSMETKSVVKKPLGQLTLNGQVWEFVVEDHTGELSLIAILPDKSEQPITDVARIDDSTIRPVPNELGRAIIDKAEQTDQIEEFGKIMERYSEELKSLASIRSRSEERAGVEDRDEMSESSDENNGHRTRLFEMGDGSRKEYLEQAREGDCVIVNYLNMHSFVHDGSLPMTVRSARNMAVDERQRYKARHPEDRRALDPEEIRDNDVPLDNLDMVRLFSKIYNDSRQDDIINVDGMTSEDEVRRKAGLILTQLENYSSGMCALGIGNHSMTIMEAGGRYFLFDPLGAVYAKDMSRQEAENFIFDHIKGRSANNNLFFYLRTSEDHDE